MRARRPAARRLLSLVAAVLALTLLSPLPGTWLIRPAPIANPDVILSLASHERERFVEVVAQARRWPSATVMLTVPALINEYNCDACPHRRGWLQTLGVEASRIVVLERPTMNTRHELSLTAAWMRARRLRRLQVVTSPYHTRRARVLARGSTDGLTVGVVASPAVGGLPKPWWTRHYGRWYVAYEHAALGAAWWRYGTRPWVE